MDRLLISVDLLEFDLCFHQWVGCGGESDHQPIFLQILGHDKILHSPFKFNPHWLEHEDLVLLLKNTWKFFDNNSVLSSASQFSKNLKKIKNVSICWSVKRKDRDTKELIEIELLLGNAYFNVGFGYTTEADKDSLYALEARRRNILLDREKEARHKSRAIWLLYGDDNTPFFHKFANNRKFVNTIWKIADDRGNIVEGFEYIAGREYNILKLCFKLMRIRDSGYC